MSFFVKRNYFLIGVLPLLILSLAYVIMGSYGIERSTRDLERKVHDLKEAKKKNVDALELHNIKTSLNKARYDRSMNLYMLVCAGVMIVHALMIFEMKNKWVSAYGTIALSLVVMGVLRKYNDIGSHGTNNFYISMGAGLTLIAFVFSARGLRSVITNDDEE